MHVTVLGGTARAHRVLRGVLLALVCGGVCDVSGAGICCCMLPQILYKNNHNAIATTMVLLYCLSHYLMGVIMYFEMVSFQKAAGLI